MRATRAAWNNRIADQAFNDLNSMADHFSAIRKRSAERPVAYGDLRLEAASGEVFLRAPNGRQVHLNPWTTKQMSKIAGAPADYITSLPATLAVQNLNHGLKVAADAGNRPDAQLLIHCAPDDGRLTLRSITSNRYSRIWNDELISRTVDMIQSGDGGWELAELGKGHTIRGGSELEGATRGKLPGAFASDHDAHVFMVNRQNPIDDGTGQPMFRAFFLRNSETGSGSLVAKFFNFMSYCSNTCFFGVSGMQQVRIRHTGMADVKAWTELGTHIRQFANRPAREMEAQIAKARTMLIAESKDEVIDELFRWRVGALTRKRLGAAYELAEKVDAYGDPRSPWGMSNGLTELSQVETSGRVDDRLAIDEAAGRIMALAA